jgi:hypothetical protein
MLISGVLTLTAMLQLQYYHMPNIDDQDQAKEELPFNQ